MAMSTTTFCLVLGCLTLSLFHSSSSSRCGDEKFYCPTNEQCFDRNLRCTSSEPCDEVKCFKSGSTYEYYKKTSSLFQGSSQFLGSSSKTKQSLDYRYELSHWFVEYRGFVYEFGKTYRGSVQELDVNDPNYKYGPKGSKKVLSEERMGSSSCTRDQVLSFKDKWLRANPDYDLLRNNCQHFAKKLLEELKNNCPNRDDDDTESLKAPTECYSNSLVSLETSSFWSLH